MIKAQIRVDGIEVDVPASASTVLRQILLAQDSLAVWVDAICINQNNLDERADQVQLMYEVYRNSRMTLVYLGDDDANTRALLDLLRTIEGLCPKGFHHVMKVKDTKSELLNQIDTTPLVSLLEQRQFTQL